MLPDRILPEEIQGMSVPTEMIRLQLIDDLKKHNLIQIDSQGRETIHHIPVHEFISVEHNLPVSIVERCS